MVASESIVPSCLLLLNTPVSYSTPCMRLNQLNWLMSPSLSPIHKTRYVIWEQKRPMTSKCGCRILIKNWIYRAEKLINIVENDSLGLKERSSFVSLLSKFCFFCRRVAIKQRVYSWLRKWALFSSEKTISILQIPNYFSTENLHQFSVSFCYYVFSAPFNRVSFRDIKSRSKFRIISGRESF